jgi:glycosyltransferase involved in cell wall biosynthesis
VRYVFLTACRNEEMILAEFLREFSEMTLAAQIDRKAVLYVVDDLSSDRSIEILEAHRRSTAVTDLKVICAPTNFGNQGALFYGLSKIEVDPDDVLITFDCDGEDDVKEIPSIIKLGTDNPGKLVLIERGQRKESLIFRIAFFFYKVLFRFLTGQRVIPNNFLLIPAVYVPAIQRTPTAAVHFAYAVLKLRLPSITTRRNRRQRYGGGAGSQNLFMVASHGLVGLMIFYETVVAKLLFLLGLVAVWIIGMIGAAMFLRQYPGTERALLWLSGALAGFDLGFLGLLIAAALAFIFKLAVFNLARLGAEAPPAPKHRAESADEERDAARF